MRPPGRVKVRRVRPGIWHVTLPAFGFRDLEQVIAITRTGGEALSYALRLVEFRSAPRSLSTAVTSETPWTPWTVRGRRQ